ncbi:Oidioi.mRNA.OKI2018_I69.PAR.g11967.t1.cds [Oikopleura dioica]|uniref:Oidioi.mRNA.OKI2018_I69.PAR.g11967.t1.cds n=1 Tax=Oikopleura dioica TaxID=34765 RepID=A0ABN7S2X1_OIKDI|nr:Oidioi.mRNA.OKI2018_I69.PAR.g11967.t1.cds [Oikopleura dioica]
MDHYERVEMKDRQQAKRKMATAREKRRMEKLNNCIEDLRLMIMPETKAPTKAKVLMVALQRIQYLENLYRQLNGQSDMYQTATPSPPQQHAQMENGFENCLQMPQEHVDMQVPLTPPLSESVQFSPDSFFHSDDSNNDFNSPARRTNELSVEFNFSDILMNEDASDAAANFENYFELSNNFNQPTKMENPLEDIMGVFDHIEQV